MNWTVIIANLLFLIGLAAITTGAGMVYLPAAPIVGGSGLILVGVAMARGAGTRGAE